MTYKGVRYKTTIPAHDFGKLVEIGTVAEAAIIKYLVSIGFLVDNISQEIFTTESGDKLFSPFDIRASSIDGTILADIKYQRAGNSEYWIRAGRLDYYLSYKSDIKTRLVIFYHLKHTTFLPIELLPKMPILGGDYIIEKYYTYSLKAISKYLQRVGKSQYLLE